MAGHICDNCGAAVAGEQFCPTCGAWVDPLQTGVDDGEFEEFSLGSVPSEERDGADATLMRLPRQEVQCPSCGSPNPANNRHCEACGARLSQGALPVAPRPAVQTTAGVRAAMGISAVLVLVVIAVVISNLFGGSTPSSTTTAASNTTVSTAPKVPEPLDVLKVTCVLGDGTEMDPTSGFPCSNLTDGSDSSEFQFNWENLPADAGNPTIKITFPFRVAVRGVVWTNISDPTRFQQNYRVKTVRITDGTGPAFPANLKNQEGSQQITFVSTATNEIQIELTDAIPSVDVDGQRFNDLAIAEIQILGWPADQAPAQQTTTGDSSTSSAG